MGSGSGCGSCGGAGQYQNSSQWSATLQGALSSATAKQNAVNANVPVNIAGGNIYSGGNSASQYALNGAESNANNSATTTQTNNQNQMGSGSGCGSCGGAGQYQNSTQGSLTGQLAASTGKGRAERGQRQRPRQHRRREHLQRRQQRQPVRRQWR